MRGKAGAWRFRNRAGLPVGVNPSENEEGLGDWSTTMGDGFRSSFKGWARHEDAGEVLAGFALAHVEGSKAVAACAGDGLFERRRPAMQAWCVPIVAGG